ncbi:MAG: polysulfide reductase NrfD [Planctomycetes bacterium]|nr:polysulfide reductase NrfD [Planctomycetota bacterium]MCP4771195.1 polysulfide reductase NrfD [Planctomycetota bacterium]MCP4862078.1 polysulfide reductase NrfD [Planctomycetota bacterium]
MKTLNFFGQWVAGSIRIVLTGNKLYYAWVAFLMACTAIGLWAYTNQLSEGLITTSLRDQVSWGFYIGNFTFLVGVAAAAVTLVVPAYLYNWKPIKEIVVYGELLAVAAITMCALFVMVDIGHPERFWHLIPGPGILNVPSSMLAWDVIALNGYLVLNFVITTYLLFRLFQRKEPNKRIFMPLVWLSIPAAIAIHTVTAFLYAGLISRPYWNSAILAPRFIVSAFCSGPAVMLVLMQILQRFSKFKIRKEAMWKISELMAYFMGFNLFLLGAEVFKEYYSDTHHVTHMHYMFTGVEGHDTLVPWMWFAVGCSFAAFFLFLRRKSRQNIVLMNIGCLLIFMGVYIEKSMGMVIPGMTPDTLGEIYEYVPSINELLVALGIVGFGGLMFTFMVKIATPILDGEFYYKEREAKKKD